MEARAEADTMRAFCIGHRLPAFPLWPEMLFVTDQPSIGVGWRIDPEAGDCGGLSSDAVGEYAGLFAIRRRLEADGFGGTVVLAQYRRFTSRQAFGRPDARFPRFRIVSPQAVSAVAVRDLYPDCASGWLVPRPLRVPSRVGSQYREHHVFRDFLRFLSDAVDAGAIDSDEAHRAMFADRLIPACSVGCYPAPVFLTIFRRLETAATAFMEGGHRRREGYQRRSLGFCLERLNSFLVLEALKAARTDPALCFGYQMVVTDDAAIHSSP